MDKVSLTILLSISISHYLLGAFANCRHKMYPVLDDLIWSTGILHVFCIISIRLGKYHQQSIRLFNKFRNPSSEMQGWNVFVHWKNYKYAMINLFKEEDFIVLKSESSISIHFLL